MGRRLLSSRRQISPHLGDERRWGNPSGFSERYSGKCSHDETGLAMMQIMIKMITGLWSVKPDTQAILHLTGSNYFQYLPIVVSDGLYLAYTNLHMVYYYGNWYWDYTRLGYINQAGVIGYMGYEDTKWNVDWATMDIQSPTTSMGQLSSAEPYQFVVTWSGQDNLSGVQYFDVQMREGAAGAWTNWHMGTTDTSATFTGIGGHEYFFRSRAKDNAHNLGSWPASYQAHTEVESAAPVTQVNRLDEFTRGDAVTVTWEGHDNGGSAIKNYDIQVMDRPMGWIDCLTDTLLTTEFTGELGHTYQFRSEG
jgi:hypothetical protein